MATAEGRPYWVVAREPLHRVVWAHAQYGEVERVDGLVVELEALNAAYRINAAVNAPKVLQTMRDDLYARLREGPSAGPRGPLSDEEKAIAAALFAAVRAAHASEAAPTAPAEVS